MTIEVCAFSEILENYVKSIGIDTTIQEIPSGSVRFYHLRSSGKWMDSLLLLFQKQNEDWICIAALKAIEKLGHTSMYIMRESSISYIEFVEASGLFEPRTVQSVFTKSLVLYYLESLRGKIQWVNWFATGHCHRSDKDKTFIFPKSRKSILYGNQVAQWWCSVVSRLKDSRLVMVEPWKEGAVGFPFASIEDIPSFPDDPLTKHLELFGKSGDSCLNRLLQSLSIRPEYLNDAGTHFYISFNDPLGGILESNVDKTLIESILDAMRDSDWSEQSASSSSSRILSLLEDIECHNLEVSDNLLICIASMKQELKQKRGAEGPATSIQNLVKRKK